MSSLGDQLLNLAMLSTGAGLGALVFSWCARGATARTRMVVVRAGLVALALTPLAVGWSAAGWWPKGVASRVDMGAEVGTAGAAVAADGAAEASESGVTVLDGRGSAVLAGGGGLVADDVGGAEVARGVAVWTRAVRAVEAGVRDTREMVGVTRGEWVAAVWAAGVLLLGAGLARDWRRVRGLLGRARPGEPAAARVLAELAGGGAEAARVCLWRSSEVDRPFVTGWARAHIVLPEGLTDEGRLRRVLAHEWGHVGGGDLRWQGLGAVVRAALWFQPLAWVLHARHEALAEELADTAALRVAGDGADYARDLCDYAGAAALPAAGFGLVRGRSRLRRRVERLFLPHMKTNQKLHPSVAFAGVLFTTASLLGGMALTTFGASAQAAEPAVAAAATVATTADVNERLNVALKLPAEESLKALGELNAEAPDNVYVAYWLGVAEGRAGKVDEARARFAGLLQKRAPGWVTTWSAVRLAEGARKSGDDAAAAGYAAQARMLVTEFGDGGQLIEPFLESVMNPRPARTEVEPLLRAALQLKGEESVRALADLRATYPRDLYVTYWLGVRMLESGEKPLALNAARGLFREVAEARTENWVTAWATYRLAGIARVTGDVIEADALELKAVRLAEEYGNGGQSISRAMRAARL